METEKRKGARSIKEIPASILQQLNNGQIETTNLMEWLAIDQRLLLKNILTQLKRTKYTQPILTGVEALTKKTINTVNETIGYQLLQQTILHKDGELLSVMASHTSDSVRCWVAYAIGKTEGLSIKKLLTAIKPFAADSHFGVREIAWMAVRTRVDKELDESLTIFETWVTHKDENIRRFTTEVTRPRGVWCSHIEILKQKPELAIRILELLKNDASKYVQNSVANWLNDTSKTQPLFARKICIKWQKESNTKATEYIVKRALRTIEKKVK